MPSLLEGAKNLQTLGTDIGDRLDGLAAATDAAQGRLDDGLVESARAVVERAQGRLKLSSEHTVVGIAGATGSGKSSTFNALTGLELSAVGVRRPTTSWATACVWGSQGARELLEWLGIPDRHQTTRDSMLDTRREGHELDGVVLLDLPDHDSTEVAHHLEVDRLVELADMLIWVLDPQKYADAAIHDRYLEPLKSHAEVMVVVLNHIDKVPEERRESMLADVRRLLDNDGLQQVPVIPVSARLGWGIPELKQEIARRVADKRATKSRLEADVKAAAGAMREVSGEVAPKKLEKARIEALDDAIAEAAGVPTIVDAVQRSTRLRAGRATGWPLVSWISGLRPDPLKRLHLDLGAEGRVLTGRARTSLPEATQVQRARVDTEVRALADETGSGLGGPWRESIRRASVSHIDELNDRLDAALGDVDLGASRLPVWAGLVRVLQWLLIIAALGGAVWTIALAVSGTLSDKDTTKVAGIALPLAVLVGAVVVGIVLALVCRVLVAGTARTRAATADRRLREAVSGVSSELVVKPIEAELAAYGVLREGLAKALA
ncbi:YfjP family GTPase [Nocardioides sp.]|jgi:GTPase Era involved in 16S rRNA processing|uniref:YfjP family GTPase n=1 Tax=Nocardioides sp. TaxID=35761 RepID=UPI002BBEEE68|nr:YfjP family GTPase [Nocardioides sp.]HVX54402.1 YfjP family GTPase [Nocardioides sp.]